MILFHDNVDRLINSYSGSDSELRNNYKLVDIEIVDES